MAARRRYTRTEKAEAVGQAIATSAEVASEQTGIPATTIRYWAKHPDFAELRETTRDQLADELWATIQVGVSEVAKGLRAPDVPLRDKVVALGVLYDKHALLTGAATSRSESRDITGTVSDAELVAAVREAEHLTGAGRTPAPVEGTPEG
jgi:hypothetical protein